MLNLDDQVTGEALKGVLMEGNLSNGNGSLNYNSTTTDMDGTASVLWTLGTNTNQQLNLDINGTTYPIDIQLLINSNGTMTDARDGQIYEITTIGGTTWMAENLRYQSANSEFNSNSPTSRFGRLYDCAFPVFP